MKRKLREDEQYEFQYIKDGFFVYKIAYMCDDEWYYVKDFNGEDELIFSEIEL